jgi:hypothetical protein
MGQLGIHTAVQGPYRDGGRDVPARVLQPRDVQRAPHQPSPEPIRRPLDVPATSV